MLRKPEAVYVSVASNVEPRRHILSGLRRLHLQLPIRAASPFYRTQPIRRPGDPEFLNGVVRVDATVEPRELRIILRAVEDAEGRRRGGDPYGPRPLDLDVLLYGRRTFTMGSWQVPDPDIQERPFLRRALLDLDPGLELPDGTPIQEPAEVFQAAPGFGLADLLHDPVTL